MGGGGHPGETKLQFTPTWIIALVCSGIVLISILVERRLHSLGKFLKKKNQKTLFEALQKVKEELMLLGFISLFLTVFQRPLHEICIPGTWNHHMLPCNKGVEKHEEALEAAAHFSVGVLSGARRTLSAKESPAQQRHCKMGSVPLISLEALHQLHIFIFILAVTHVVFTVFTVVCGSVKIKQWKQWEESIRPETKSGQASIILEQQFEFIQKHYDGAGKDSVMLQRLYSFCKQFYGSVDKSDYSTMRLGFIMTHCKTNPKFDFHKYMVRALEADFKKVVGISWYLWAFGMLFLLLNINGWHTYFWMAFIPLVLLFVVGMKLELVITQLARDVADQHLAFNGELVVKPSDEHFWFKRPRIMLYLIHFIMFQNAFEIAFFFWILATYGLRSCIMDRIDFVIPRLIIGVIIQIVCSYSTLPLYAIVTQMGSTFSKSIFEDHVQESLLGWAKLARKRRSQRVNDEDEDEGQVMEIQMLQLLSSSRRTDSLEEARYRGQAF